MGINQTHSIWSSTLYQISFGRALRGSLASPSHARHGKKRPRTLSEPTRGTLPLDPLIQLPNPSILEGLPRRLASPKHSVLRNYQEDIKSVARIHSLMLLLSALLRLSAYHGLLPFIYINKLISNNFLIVQKTLLFIY